MGKPRYEYYYRAFICFFLSAVCVILPFIPSIRESGISFGTVIGLGGFLLFVGLINYFIAKEDSNDEKRKDKRIEELEKELDEIKKDKLKDYD